MITQPDPKIIKKIRRNLRAKQKSQIALFELESKLIDERDKTHQHIITDLAEKSGVKLDPVMKEARRRNRAQKRLVKRQYKKLRIAVHKRIKAVSKKRLEFGKEYHERYLKELETKEGNPCLMFWRPNEQDEPRTRIFNGGRRTQLYWTCTEPEFAEFRSESDVTLATEYGDRNHIINFMNYAKTGDDNLHVWQIIENDIVLTGRALTPGRGNFRLESMYLWLNGIGYCELRRGYPPFGTGWMGHSSHASIEADVVVMQRYDPSHDGYIYDHVLHTEVWGTSGAYSGEAMVEPSLRHDLGTDMILYSEEEGGHEINIYFRLTSIVYANYDGASALLDFRSPEYDGINLHDIRLCGSYDH